MISDIHERCPSCGGADRIELAQGFFECKSKVLVEEVPPGVAGVGAPLIRRYRTCSTRYQTSAAGTSVLCRCGLAAVGACVRCFTPVCGKDARFVEGNVHCAACAQVIADERAEEAEHDAIVAEQALLAYLRSVANPTERILRAIRTSQISNRDGMLWLTPAPGAAAACPSLGDGPISAARRPPESRDILAYFATEALAKGIEPGSSVRIRDGFTKKRFHKPEPAYRDLPAWRISGGSDAEHYLDGRSGQYMGQWTLAVGIDGAAYGYHLGYRGAWAIADLLDLRSESDSPSDKERWNLHEHTFGAYERVEPGFYRRL